ncbi:ATP-binding protein [Paenibacillus camelliae]|uniref:ATP-binding protein n=1 Tax=Paenibacillus camelliae TaxID=512410 RepID=UPI0020405496|nr:ATP-binding protein [Paenibacillus camelliae]MCM3635292.1 PAS domain S-box protein [Paenibacillus camelliae]
MLVIVVFQILWEYNHQQSNADLLGQSSQTLSERLIQHIHIEAPQADTQLSELFRFIQADKPYLIDLAYIDEGEGKQLLAAGEKDQVNAALLQLNKAYDIQQSHQFREVHALSKEYYISDYRTQLNSGQRMVLLYDKKLYDKMYSNDNNLFYAVLIYLVFFTSIASYWFVSRMLRPLKDILWKVNEVSSVRFQRPIPITTKDEFGLLAFKINAMSQNLSIYMNKLRHAFDENRRMRLYMESFINHSSDAIYIMDVEGRVIQANKAFEELFGFSAAEAIGNRYRVVPEHLIKEKEELLRLVQKGEVIKPIETYRQTKDGETIPVSITISPIRDINNEITGFANICRDMRHRHRMEELMRRSEKLNTVGQLAAGVAHEIRNPLTTLRGFLQLQVQSKKLNLDHVRVMLSELERINLIVGEFLILSKPQAVKFKYRDIRDIIAEVSVFMSSEALMHNVVIKENYTNDDCSIPCEDNQLKQVFINVLKNAIEAMPNGGQVHIAIQRLANHVSVQVTDEGIGMDEETLKRIGDPFFTVKENGTGLGIMVSQKIIQSHQGLMELSSQVNVGTTVRILLPLSEERNQYAEASNL